MNLLVSDARQKARQAKPRPLHQAPIQLQFALFLLLLVSLLSKNWISSLPRPGLDLCCEGCFYHVTTRAGNWNWQEGVHRCRQDVCKAAQGILCVCLSDFSGLHYPSLSCSTDMLSCFEDAPSAQTPLLLEWLQGGFQFTLTRTSFIFFIHRGCG